MLTEVCSKRGGQGSLWVRGMAFEAPSNDNLLHSTSAQDSWVEQDSLRRKKAFTLVGLGLYFKRGVACKTVPSELVLHFGGSLLPCIHAEARTGYFRRMQSQDRLGNSRARTTRPSEFRRRGLRKILMGLCSTSDTHRLGCLILKSGSSSDFDLQTDFSCTKEELKS